MQAGVSEISGDKIWIVHLCQDSTWRAAQEQGVYRPDSLAEVGFIHCSRPEQVVAVANRYYTGFSDLVLLWIDPDRLQAELRWEAADGELYPHIYGLLNFDAVRAVGAFPAAGDGHFYTDPVLPGKD